MTKNENRRIFESDIERARTISEKLSSKEIHLSNAERPFTKMGSPYTGSLLLVIYFASSCTISPISVRGEGVRALIRMDGYGGRASKAKAELMNQPHAKQGNVGQGLGMKIGKRGAYLLKRLNEE